MVDENGCVKKERRTSARVANHGSGAAGGQANQQVGALLALSSEAGGALVDRDRSIPQDLVDKPEGYRAEPPMRPPLSGHTKSWCCPQRTHPRHSDLPAMDGASTLVPGIWSAPCGNRYILAHLWSPPISRCLSRNSALPEPLASCHHAQALRAGALAQTPIQMSIRMIQ